MPRYFGVGYASVNANTYPAWQDLEIFNAGLENQPDYTFCDQIEILPQIKYTDDFAAAVPLFAFAPVKEIDLSSYSINLATGAFIVFDISKGESLFLPVYGNANHPSPNAWAATLFLPSGIVPRPTGYWHISFKWIYTQPVKFTSLPTYAVVNIPP